MMSRQQTGEERVPRAAAPVPRAAGDSVFVDNRLSAATQRRQQERVDSSRQALQLRAYAEMGRRGPQALAQRMLADQINQGRPDAEPAQLAGQERPAANHTGLPDLVKSGIENLSGMSMDHVRVHYNSSQPARLNAHAYAQGSEIHVAPGQEQHLPHEAWHVVQQAQGRVKPTMQMKGIGVNDDAGLETEADLMGARALTAGPAQRRQLSAPAMAEGQPMQLARYLKCIQNPGNIPNEILRLTHASPLDANNTFGGIDPASWNQRPIDLNRWLAGGAGNSVTHYNPGQNQYYSPVGYIVDVAPARVLGNYAGDGNTSTLHSDQASYWQAVEAIRGALTADAGVNAEIIGNGYTANFAAAVTDKATAIVLTGRIEHFLGNGAVDADAKIAAKDIIKTAASAALVLHYANNGMHRLAAGDPVVLAGLEAHLQGLMPGVGYHNPAQGRENKYTESQVHAELGHVVGTFYATGPGVYPNLIDASWLTDDPAWLNNRRTAAQQFKQQFATAGNANVDLMVLSAGALASAPTAWSALLTRDFFRWATLAAGGFAMLVYANLPYLQQLFEQYQAANRDGAE